VFGLLFSIALMGGMLFPWTVGQISQRLSVRAGMTVPSLGAVGIILLSAIVFVRERNAGLISTTGDARSSIMR
jgi:hypothetical protein